MHFMFNVLYSKDHAVSTYALYNEWIYVKKPLKILNQTEQIQPIGASL